MNRSCKNNKSRENELILMLRSKVQLSEVGKLFVELCSTRLERYKNELVKEEGLNNNRGRAQELRDILRLLTETEGA